MTWWPAVAAVTRARAYAAGGRPVPGRNMTNEGAENRGVVGEVRTRLGDDQTSKPCSQMRFPRIVQRRVSLSVYGRPDGATDQRR